ncbi:ROK family transcriptional regulator [Rubrimonas sp.]|uniref:ROK family transcriptional regulator n=1 Tax=Rubrimonas sp. TaxID=2036015 RepID=UPI002FDC7BD3
MPARQIPELRSDNERRVIAAIRARGALSRAEIARLLGLSAPGASTIVGGLADRGLLRAQAKQRGHIGQPITPFTLDPEGACAIGVKIGRRSVEAALVDLLGEVVAAREVPHDGPDPRPDPAASFVLAREMVAELMAEAPQGAARFVGVGVAIPGDISGWSAAAGEPAPGDLWRDVDVAAALRLAPGLRVETIPDSAAALVAQLARGPSIGHGAALCLYLGTFVGGGLAIAGRLHAGDHGAAGALAAAPVPGPALSGGARQLLHDASLRALEEALAARGHPAMAVIRGQTEAPEAEALFAEWLGTAAPALAHAAAAAHAVVDLSHVFIDGVFRPEWRARTVEATREALARMRLAGLAPPLIEAGCVGWPARVLGAALTPLERVFGPMARGHGAGTPGAA